MVSSTFLLSCRSVKEPQYIGLDYFRIGKVQLDTSTIDIGLKYFNPNNFGVRLKESICDIYLDSLYLGHFILRDQMQIGAQEYFVLPLKGRVNTASLAKNSLNALFGKEMLVKIDGTARLGKAMVFFTYPVHYEGRHTVKLF
jgi:LEA14-like dessication related protein